MTHSQNPLEVPLEVGHFDPKTARNNKKENPANTDVYKVFSPWRQLDSNQ